MKIAVSNLPYQGLFTNRLIKLPQELGIEIYSETGSDFYWAHLLPRLMAGRKGSLSVHGPYQTIDLSSPKQDFEEVKGAYEWTFMLCRKYLAKHCICHPYAYHPIGAMDESEILARRQLCIDRINELNTLAKTYGVDLLIENMANKDGLLSQQTFWELFGPFQDLNFLIDLGHANIQGWDIHEMFEQLGSRIHAYHVNDNFGDSDSHLMAFEGSFDWDSFFSGYKKYTPEAALVCEYMRGTVDEIVASVESIKSRLTHAE